MRFRRSCMLALGLAIFGPTPFLTAAPVPATRPAATRPAAARTLDQLVHDQVATILNGLENGESYVEAVNRLDLLFDQVVANASDKSLDAIRDAAFARRMVRQLASVPDDKRLDLLKYLRANDSLARSLAFMMGASAKAGEQAGEYAVLNQLRESFGDRVAKYETLTTAICVVHAQPFTRRINENVTTAPAPGDIFDYYATNEKAMLFGIRNVPAELLVYVVDTTASIDDMKWALKKYAGDQAVGRHFFDIPYDYEHFKKDTPKKVTEMGYNLPNILKYGGVCADQAFFAMSIGKAIGVPTAYATGQSAEVGHAWVGFLQARGDKGLWNFDEGRYAEYRGVKGSVIDPQTRLSIPDSYVSLLAELIGTHAADRQAAVALTDAAIRAGQLGDIPFAPPELDPKPSDARPAPRVAGVDSALELLEAARNQNKGYSRAWFVVWNLAKDGKLTTAQKVKWSDKVLELCGAKYPDFALTVLEPMIGTVDDPKQQNTLWEKAFVVFQNRSDLAATIRMDQARLWEDQNETNKAGKCYEDVINRFVNAGPFVLPALQGAEKLLDGKPDKILKLYEQTWTRIDKPRDMAGPFMRQSNWYKVGMIYAQKLRDAGQAPKSDAIMSQIGATAASK